jgi:hypothetical protein
VDWLAAGIAQRCSINALQIYCSSFSRQQVQQRINILVKGKHPVLFYAAERNCSECFRLLLTYGCNPNSYDGNGVPALAYTIMRSQDTVQNPADAVKLLVAFGATPHSIPADMWSSFLDAPSSDAPNDNPDEASRWCTP